MADIANAYCAIEDVQAHAQQVYSASTKPTLAQVQGFAVQRSGIVYGWIRDVMGSAALGPAGYAAPLSAQLGTDAGKALDAVARRAAAIGAAVDALEASQAGEEPSGSDRVVRLRIEFDGTEGAEGGEETSELEEAVKDAARGFLGVAGTAARSANHLSVGELTAAPVQTRQEPGLVFDDRTEF